MMEAEINIFEHKEKRLLARRAVNKAKDQKAAAAAGTRTVA